MRDTSLSAYWSARAGGAVSEGQASILEELALFGGATRRELAEGLDKGINSICGRVNELLKSGLVTDTETTIDEETGKRVHVVRLSDKLEFQPEN